MDTNVTLKELADEFGLDRSNTRKYILEQGFSPIRVRDLKSHQLVLALSPEDAASIRQIRDRNGFLAKDTVVESCKGYFYIIQLVPDLAPLRVKLGFANNVSTRLQAHRTSAPTAELFAFWPCDRLWEPVVIACITRTGCVHIANEVYTCDGLENIKERAQAFFDIMPILNGKT